MQLDLFLDNRRTILKNLADEHLRELELEEAAALYDRILADVPGDSAITSAKQSLETWRSLLEDFHSSPAGADPIYTLYRNLSKTVPAPLRDGIRNFIIQQLECLPSPELIFIPPRFHLGSLLLETGKPDKAETWFALALDSGIAHQGRFLAYLGDALFMKGETDEARVCYRDAFLLSPHEIDFDHLRDRAVRELIGEMEEEGLSEEAAIRWIPVWGWLQGLFTLGAATEDESSMTGGELPGRGKSPEEEAPRLWFRLLRTAEHVRTEKWNDAELVRVRREMKELNAVMFSRYMKKLRG